RDANAVRSLVIGALSRVLAGGAAANPDGLSVHRPSLSLASFRPAPRGGIRTLPLPGFAPPSQTAVAEAPVALYGRSPEPDARMLDLGTVPAARVIAPGEPTDHPLGAAVAQVLDTYIIAVATDGAMVLVDQHAAHERLTHVAIRERMLDGAA